MSPQEIKTQREQLGLTQEALAELLGVVSVKLAQWETGAAAPESATMLRLALDHIVMMRHLVDDPRMFQAVRQLTETKAELQQMLAEA
ncbi:MAG: helix-turn-helix domain-containing protein [Acidobacteria bacterium]|nr:helix-turn-helix domain-containing protein [Acidobacteriota bacterium]